MGVLMRQKQQVIAHPHTVGHLLHQLVVIRSDGGERGGGILGRTHAMTLKPRLGLELFLGFLDTGVNDREIREQAAPQEQRGYGRQQFPIHRFYPPREVLAGRLSLEVGKARQLRR